MNAKETIGQRGDTIYQASINYEGDAEVRAYIITQVRRDGRIRVRSADGRSMVPFYRVNLDPSGFTSSPQSALSALRMGLEAELRQHEARIARVSADLLAITRHAQAPRAEPKICPVCKGQARASKRPAPTWTCRACGRETCEHHCSLKVDRSATCGRCKR